VRKTTHIRVTALVDNVVYSEDPILAESAISLFIEVEREGRITRILFDTGLTGDPLVRNSKLLGVDLSQVDFVIVSHNHYDHTGGLLKALKEIGRKVPIVMHPEIFEPKYMIITEVVDAGGMPVFSRNPVLLTTNIMTTGEIERIAEFEKTSGFYMVKDGEFVKDKLADDQALIVKMDDESVVVFTGCAHSGVVNTVHHALKLTNSKKVRAIIGGFHLMDADEERIEKTAQILREIGPDIVAPMHCTGFKAKMRIAEALPEVFKEFYCGSVLEIK